LDVDVEHGIAAELDLHVHRTGALRVEGEIVRRVAIVAEPALQKTTIQISYCWCLVSSISDNTNITLIMIF